MRRMQKKIYMTVLKNLLPAQRHLILVCQDYSVCMKSWPRAPGLQVKEGEGNSTRGGSCHLGCWTWVFLFLPKYSAFCPSFHAVGVGMCPLWPELFIHFCSKCLLCACMVQKRRCPHMYLRLIVLYTVALVHSGIPSWCLHWESQVFPVILPFIGPELQGFYAPELLCFLEFEYFSPFDLFLGKFHFDLRKVDWKVFLKILL